jgi:hypothetical protein
MRVAFVRSWHIGNVHVDYSRTRVVLQLPGEGLRCFTITGLEPSHPYAIQVARCGGSQGTTTAFTDAWGVLQFRAPVGQGGSTCEIGVWSSGATIVEDDSLYAVQRNVESVDARAL